jgi:catechol 2,3-dioxygenase
MTVRPRRIGHIGLVSRDLDRLVAWYERVLGFQVSDRMPYPEDHPYYEGVWMRCNSDHHVVSMFGLRETPPAPESPRGLDAPGFHHVAYEMASFEDLRRIARYAKDHDVPIQGVRTGGPGIQLRVYIWDPDDHMVELFWGLDQIGWDGRTRPYPGLEPIDLETMDIEQWLAWKGPEFLPGAPDASVADG